MLLAYASQGQIAATHQTLGTGQEVANLRAKLTVRCPALAHGVNAEQCPGNVAMVSARLRRIKRLQGVQVQQGSTRDFLWRPQQAIDPGWRWPAPGTRVNRVRRWVSSGTVKP